MIRECLDIREALLSHEEWQEKRFEEAMANERFIEGKQDGAHHAGARSTRQRLEASASALVGFAEGVRLRHIQSILQGIRTEAPQMPLEEGIEQEISTFPQWMQEVAKTNTVYNQSVSLEWQQIDPAEDYKPDISNPTRIDPSS